MSTPQNATVSKITTSKQAIEYEHEYAAHNYHPIPVVFKKLQEWMFGTLKTSTIWIFVLLLSR